MNRVERVVDYAVEMGGWGWLEWMERLYLTCIHGDIGMCLTPLIWKYLLNCFSSSEFGRSAGCLRTYVLRSWGYVLTHMLQV
jgi:hypothetical protein